MVLEAAPEVGSRLKTLRHLPGSSEAGSQSINSMYARVLRTIGDLDIGTIPRIASAPGEAVLAGGRVMSVAQ